MIATVSAIRANQLGYPPNGPKFATVVTASSQPLRWGLRDSADRMVATGLTECNGLDPASADWAHHADFSAHRRDGTGYRLEVAGVHSSPFAIAEDLYAPVCADALAFFYHQRSGIEIAADLVGPAHARPAGHLGVPPNNGDTAVAAPASVGGPALDVSGGWYDAGDHGKYVVNGGFATWQLINAYECCQHLEAFDADVFDRMPRRVPEPDTGQPPLLDEVRWQMEFLLRMQVPHGQPMAGMAFHKVCDREWTTIPQRPELDGQVRVLAAPTTAATLNLAAVAAQGARVYRRFDRLFAERCLAAARTAWAAAVANPEAYAVIEQTGSGSYEDFELGDDFYWAAAELYVTTGEQVYADQLDAFGQHPGSAVGSTGFTWNATAPLGDITLAVVPNGRSATAGEAARAGVVAAADQAVKISRMQAYPVPLSPDEYVWGSNGDVLNRAMVMALAEAFTGRHGYRDAALSTVDYLFGRNATGYCYVTGYGSRPASRVHHRFWAGSRDASLPQAPPGCLVGGPNANLDDAISRRLLPGLPPQRCYLDDIDAYATNEVAINWNSALVWVSAYLARR